MSLGKGLGSLIPIRNNAINIQNQVRAAETNESKFQSNEISISEISVNPQQPRKNFRHQDLEDLINSIKEHGILQPLIVTLADDGYELIAGERRLRAAKIAGLQKVPVIVRQASNLEKLELALIENIQRSDLDPIEKAEGYKKLVHEFGLTQDEAAKKVGISRSAFANAIRLLSLPAEIQKALAENKISEGHAKVIMGIPNERMQMAFLTKITANNLSVRELESAIDSNPGAHKRGKKITYQDPQIIAWQDELSEKLQTKISIKPEGDGGTIFIEYYSAQELKNIINKINN
ncbi:MAG: ParB/RepB/Spo0J family partition protein [Patescibacteria group bacterium]